MSGLVKRAVKGLLKRAGLEVRNRRSLYVDHVEDLQRVLGAASPLVIFDVGANRGDTVAAYRAAFPAARVHAFEPTPALAGLLAERFRADAQVTVVPQALSDRTGSSTFHMASDSLINSLLPYCDAAGAYHGVTQQSQIEVPTTTLEAYAAENAVPTIDLLKLDVQGAEKLVLRGGLRLLERQCVQAVFAEVSFGRIYREQTTLADLDALVGGRGYRLYGMYEFNREPNGSLDFCNLLYLNAAAYGRLDPRYLF